jgi:hypothetical protein
MTMSERQPRAARTDWFAQAYRLADAPGDDLSASTTPAERFEMVAELSARMWELTGNATPSYTRKTIPVHVVLKNE